jgi:hypothetical protein
MSLSQNNIESRAERAAERRRAALESGDAVGVSDERAACRSPCAAARSVARTPGFFLGALRGRRYHVA